MHSNADELVGIGKEPKANLSGGRGLNHGRPFYPQQPVKDPYQYNGKELNEEFGLGGNDYGARFYDPAVGRWTSMDPFAGKHLSHSPYNYIANRPVGSTKSLDLNGIILEGGKSIFKTK